MMLFADDIVFMRDFLKKPEANWEALMKEIRKFSLFSRGKKLGNNDSKISH